MWGIGCPRERCEVLECSMGGCRIPGCPLEAWVLTQIHSGLLRWLILPTSPNHCCYNVTSCHLQDGSGHLLQNVHLTGRNLGDMRHTVAVLGTDPDALGQSSLSLSFDPALRYPQGKCTQFASASLQLWVAVPLTLCLGVEGETFVPWVTLVKEPSFAMSWLGHTLLYGMKRAQNAHHDVRFWHVLCFSGTEWYLQGRWVANSKLFNGCLTFQVYRLCCHQMLTFSFKF